jgi:hypothetical protein
VNQDQEYDWTKIQDAANTFLAFTPFEMHHRVIRTSNHTQQDMIIGNDVLSFS